MEVSLREVVGEDSEFVFSVYSGTRAGELAVTGWSNEEKEAFCRMQFAAQNAHYRSHYPGADHSVILSGGNQIGRLYVDRNHEDLLIVDISLLPEFRGGGAGTFLLKSLQEEARAADKPLIIHVEKFNPAQRLYLRLGFVAVEDVGVYLKMRWSPEALAD